MADIHDLLWSGPSQEAALHGTAFAVTAKATPSMFSGLWDLAKLITVWVWVKRLGEQGEVSTRFCQKTEC